MHKWTGFAGRLQAWMRGLRAVAPGDLWRRTGGAARKADALAHAALQALPAHIAVVDRTGRIVDVNEAWMDFARRNDAGGMASVAVGANYLDVCRRAALSRDADADRALEGIGAVLEGARASFTMEYPCHSPSAQRWFLMTVVPFGSDEGMGAVITHLNISGRKEMEERLAFKANLLANSNDAVIATDNQFRITYWNRAAERIYGWPAAEVIGKDSYAVLRPESPPGQRQDMVARLRQGETLRSEFQHHRRDGSMIWIEAAVIPLAGPGGEIAGYASTNRDVTGRKKGEQALRAAVTELARSNRELEQFAYVSSHDLQEPLRMVTAFAGLLRDRYKGRLDAQADDYLAFTIEGATRMQVLISDLLEYSRIGAKPKNPLPFSVGISLDAARANLKAAIESSGARITHGALPAVTADERQVTQVFQNLIGNAIKYREPQVVPEIHVVAEALDGEWRFSVADNGIGIDPQYADRIFEIFQRLHTREEYEGTGVGLAICKKIVEGHGGRIWVESRPRKGSTFFFTLPA